MEEADPVEEVVEVAVEAMLLIINLMDKISWSAGGLDALNLLRAREKHSAGAMEWDQSALTTVQRNVNSQVWLQERTRDISGQEVAWAAAVWPGQVEDLTPM